MSIKKKIVRIFFVYQNTKIVRFSTKKLSSMTYKKNAEYHKLLDIELGKFK